MTIYRATISTAGLTASRLYELSKAEEKEPRSKSLIAAGFLVKQPDEHPAVHAVSPTVEVDTKAAADALKELGDKNGGADPPTHEAVKHSLATEGAGVRLGVPEIPK